MENLGLLESFKLSLRKLLSEEPGMSLFLPWDWMVPQDVKIPAGNQN